MDIGGSGVMGRMQVVWLKRDLRLSDHEPLVRAAQAATARGGGVLVLYILEPDLWAQPDMSYRHYRFLGDALVDLRAQLKARGGALVVRVGEAVGVLDALRGESGDFDLHAHEETGNLWTFRRDEAVREWCRSSGTPFAEYRQYGILRGSALDRNKWAKRWDAMMAEPVHVLPDALPRATARSQRLPAAAALGLADDGIETLQQAGRGAAEEILRSFLHERGRTYRTDMSSPVTGEWGCSRMSVHTVFGTMSMRETYQATVARQAELKDDPSDEAKAWRQSLSSFVGRLHWHCHFMQKLETEPDIETTPMARFYAGLRGERSDPVRLAAFERGETGYPFVDACMAYLRATGWINFRMRAMLMSFASYHLWLRWQDSGDVLARLFTDYEPGIHWPQSQMQSGVTGINAVRIYSPVKQGHDQDPTGDFTRRWVPALRALEGKAVHEPWKSEAPVNYPPRIVDHMEAVREAKSRIWAIRATTEAKAEAQAVFEKHGSRKGPRRPLRKTPARSAAKRKTADAG